MNKTNDSYIQSASVSCDSDVAAVTLVSLITLMLLMLYDGCLFTVTAYTWKSNVISDSCVSSYSESQREVWDLYCSQPQPQIRLAFRRFIGDLVFFIFPGFYIHIRVLIHEEV